MSVCFDNDGVGVAAIKPGADGSAELLSSQFLPLGQSEKPVDAVNQYLRQSDLQKKHCINVLAPDSYQLMQADIGALDEAEKREAARWQIRERIDYPPEEAVVDLFEVESFSGDKKPLDYVVSARQGTLRNQVKLLSDCDLQLDAIDIPEFALRNIADLFRDDAHGVGILLLLEEKGILVVAREGVLYLVRMFNEGMTDLIPYADGAYESLSERLDAIVLEIQRSFDFCESTFSLPLVSRLLVAQTQREIPAIVSYLNEYLSTRVEAFSFPDLLKVPAGIEQLDLNRNLLAIGGALRREAE